MKKLSLIVPCYNEEECIPVFYEKTKQVAKQLPLTTEFIFVDDGSKDGTLSILKKLAEENENVFYTSFSRNFGKEAAIYAGIKNADGDYVALMDVDLQDPPEMLLEMYKGIEEEGYNCVACRRVTRKNEPPLRSFFANCFYNFINKLSDTKITSGARDYRMMTKKMAESILLLQEKDRFSKGIFSWVGFKTKWLEHKNIPRVKGTTKWSFKKLAKYAVNGIEDFSFAPLKINLIFSVICFLSAFALLVTDVVFVCLQRAVPSLLILLPILFMLFSMGFFGLYVISDYIKKIFNQTKERPIYIEKESNFKKK